MSETVEITIILEQDKGTGQEQQGTQQKITVTHDFSMTLMSTLLKNKLISGNFCGGRGVCGRCRVQFLQAPPIPTSMERRAFSPEELRQGYRLACMVRPKNNCVIRLDFIESHKIDIVTDMIEMSEENDQISQEKERKKIIMQQKEKEAAGLYIIAVDLGTTTIAMQLMELRSGKVMDTYCSMNPQRSYGADVLSRIQAAGMGHAEELREGVWKVLRAGLEKFGKTLKTEKYREAEEYQEMGQICCMFIAGNTTMEHLLMGLSTETLGRSPFTPVEIGLQKCSLSGIPVYIAPGISTFVGGDIVAGLYRCNLLSALEAAGKTDEQNNRQYERGQQESSCPAKESAVLFIDLGTNGEMAITDKKRMIVTATAAGPAFEGGAGAAVPGSDMIAITASLLKQGIVDETGLLAEPYFEEGVTVNGVYLTQKDIRDLQMAKAAVRAGVEILYEKMGKPALEKVYLAGGFGYHLDVDAAIAIGLLPERMRHIVSAAGNTSLAGAYTMGRDLWFGGLKEEMLEKTLARIESINLAKQDNFEKQYLGYLNLAPS